MQHVKHVCRCAGQVLLFYVCRNFFIGGLEVKPHLYERTQALPLWVHPRKRAVQAPCQWGGGGVGFGTAEIEGRHTQHGGSGGSGGCWGPCHLVPANTTHTRKGDCTSLFWIQDVFCIQHLKAVETTSQIKYFGAREQCYHLWLILYVNAPPGPTLKTLSVQERTRARGQQTCTGQRLKNINTSCVQYIPQQLWQLWHRGNIH